MRLARRLAAVGASRRRLAAGLAQAESRYRTLVEQIPAVTYIAEFDESATLRYVSPQIESLLGYAPEAFLADQDLWYQRIHPDDRERVMAEERRVYEAGERFDMEFRMLHADGRVVWVWERDEIVRDERGEPQFSQGVVVDITAQHEAEAALRVERDRAQSYLDLVGTIVVALDAQGCVTLVNRAGCALLGYEEREILGRDWFALAVPERERDRRRALFHGVVAGEIDPDDVLERENAIVAKGGEERTVAWRDSFVRDADGRVVASLSSGEDITERRAAERQIAHLAYHDSLTGLPNRALLHEHLELALARARRRGLSVALLYVDLDDFKLVNDSLGHATGDHVLCLAATRLRAVTRETDLLARQGGDEFLLLLTDIEGDAREIAERVAAQVGSTLAEPFAIADAEFFVGASIGVSVFPADASDARTLLAHADAAMYQAKAAGHGTLAIYRGDADEPLARLSLTTRLRRAIDRGELVLHYQPVFSLASERAVGVEALLRWEDPERGLVAPGEFIPVAEETGLVEAIGAWVVDAVCSQRREWADRGLHPLVSFNVSPRQLRRDGFAETVRGALAAHGLEAGGLTVEITESTAMRDPGRVGPVLADLRALGLQIAVDDFGAGHSSLSRLRELPVQVLKVDRSFLRDVPRDPSAGAVITAIIELGRALGMSVIAEGVETEAQRRFLIEQGCPLAQGYLLAPPGPPAEIEHLLRRSSPGGCGPHGTRR